MFLLALLVGFIAGLRAFMAPLLVSWLAHLGWVELGGSWLAFFGFAWSRWVFLALALGELITDQLPSTPSRTVPPQFAARILSGALSGAAIGAHGGSAIGGLVAGILGAFIGTLGGRRFRGRLALAFKDDQPAAFIEDAIAVGAACLIGFAVL